MAPPRRPAGPAPTRAAPPAAPAPAHLAGRLAHASPTPAVAPPADAAPAPAAATLAAPAARLAHAAPAPAAAGLAVQTARSAPPRAARPANAVPTPVAAPCAAARAVPAARLAHGDPTPAAAADHPRAAYSAHAAPAPTAPAASLAHGDPTPAATADQPRAAYSADAAPARAVPAAAADRPRAARTSRPAARPAPPSGGRPALRAALAALMLALAPLGAAAQFAATLGAPVLVVDMERAVRDSAAAGVLRGLELEAGRTLSARFDALKAGLEAQEAELSDLRARLPKAEFEARVVAFDREVRQTRRAAQEETAALQARFGAAQRALLDRARPMAEALMRERGATVILDRKAVLAVEPALDVTEDLIARLDAAIAAPEALLPPPAPRPTAPDPTP